MADKKDLLSTLELLNKWKDARNELIHALFNKDYACVSEKLLPLVDEGYELVRKIDNASAQVKRNGLNYVRD